MVRSALAVLVLSTMCLASAAPAVADEDKPAVCPVSGKPANPDHWIVSEGQKIAFCCGNCEKTYIAKRENRLNGEQTKSGWKLLFNGNDLSGFREPTRDGKWTARGGILTGTDGKGVLATEETFDDFILTADVRISDRGDRRDNSGIYIRSSGLMAHRGRWPDGHEIQIDHGDPEFWTGSIWKGAHARRVETKDGEWFTMRIEAAGPRIRVFINNELVTDHVQTGPVQKGPISFQVHHETDLVEFKNLKVRALRSA